MPVRRNPRGWITVDSDDRPDLCSLEEFDMPEEFALPADAQGPFAEPSLILGITLNLGNYESARVDLGGRVPCKPEDLDATMDKLMGWAESRIESKIGEIRSETGGGRRRR